MMPHETNRLFAPELPTSTIPSYTDHLSWYVSPMQVIQVVNNKLFRDIRQNSTARPACASLAKGNTKKLSNSIPDDVSYSGLITYYSFRNASSLGHSRHYQEQSCIHSYSMF
jgi:hypothetical protein